MELMQNDAFKQTILKYLEAKPMQTAAIVVNLQYEKPTIVLSPMVEDREKTSPPIYVSLNIHDKILHNCLFWFSSLPSLPSELLTQGSCISEPSIIPQYQYLYIFVSSTITIHYQNPNPTNIRSSSHVRVLFLLLAVAFLVHDFLACACDVFPSSCYFCFCMLSFPMIILLSTSTCCQH
jgi:hypothetical protein